MKAAVIEKYGAITIRDIPEPKITGDYDVLCDLLYGATCTGTDTHLINGNPPFAHWVKLPYILGHESVGRVIKAGAKVRNFKPGDLVTRVGAPGGDGLNSGWGGFAEMGVAKDHWAMAADGLPEAEWKRARVNQTLPSGVDPKKAPMFTTWRETLSALLRMGVAEGASVLIAGSGGNGLSFAMHARNLGATSLAMVGSAKMEAAVKAKAGVAHYMDYKAEDLTNQIKAALPAGFDFMIDAVGQVGMADRLLPALKAGGRYMTYGMDGAGAVTFTASCARGAFTVMPCGYDEAETHQRVSESFLQGHLDASLWYDERKVYPLEDLSGAFDAAHARKSPKALVQLKDS